MYSIIVASLIASNMYVYASDQTGDCLYVMTGIKSTCPDATTLHNMLYTEIIIKDTPLHLQPNNHGE